MTAAEPNRRFAFRVTAPLVPIADWEYRIEPTESGCRVDETFVDLRLPPVRLVSTLRTGVADRSLFNRHSMQVTLAALREPAVRGISSCPLTMQWIGYVERLSGLEEIRAELALLIALRDAGDA